LCNESEKMVKDNQFWREVKRKKQLEKGETIVDISCTVRFAHISTCTIYDTAFIITESAKSETKALVWQDYHVLQNEHYGCESHFNCIKNK
jgi:hypothetical protein